MIDWVKYHFENVHSNQQFLCESGADESGCASDEHHGNFRFFGAIKLGKILYFL
jgi:hypothetical protein